MYGQTEVLKESQIVKDKSTVVKKNCDRNIKGAFNNGDDDSNNNNTLI